MTANQWDGLVFPSVFAKSVIAYHLFKDTRQMLPSGAPPVGPMRLSPQEKKMTAVKTPPAKTVALPAKKVPANSNKKHEFKTNDHVVYPTHGVGKVAGIEEKEVAGVRLELFIIEFEKDKMTLRVPTMKAKTVGMRKLSSPEVVAGALNTLKGRARIKRTMWSRR